MSLMEDVDVSTDAGAVIGAVERLSEAESFALERDGDDDLLVIPGGKKLVDLKPFRDARRTAPERRKGTAQHTQLSSFIEHAARFADEDSALFAVEDPRAPRLISVLDYHRATSEGAPRFGEHRGVYSFPLSDEWKAWQSVPEKMDQGTFAAFLEERITDVLDPAAVGDGSKRFAAELGLALASPTRLLELSRGLSVRVESKVASHVNLSTGETQIAFGESHASGESGGPLKIPGGFIIAIPVFRGGDLYTIAVRLVYRVHRGEGKVQWGLRLHRAERVFLDAFNGAASLAAEQTKLPLFYGTPEA